MPPICLQGIFELEAEFLHTGATNSPPGQLCYFHCGGEQGNFTAPTQEQNKLYLDTEKSTQNNSPIC